MTRSRSRIWDGLSAGGASAGVVVASLSSGSLVFAIEATIGAERQSNRTLQCLIYLKARVLCPRGLGRVARPPDRKLVLGIA